MGAFTVTSIDHFSVFGHWRIQQSWRTGLLCACSVNSRVLFLSCPPISYDVSVKVTRSQPSSWKIPPAKNFKNSAPTPTAVYFFSCSCCGVLVCVCRSSGMLPNTKTNHSGFLATVFPFLFWISDEDLRNEILRRCYEAALSRVEPRFCIQTHQSFNFLLIPPPVMNFTFLVSRGDHPNCRLTNVRPPNLPERVTGPCRQSSTIQPDNNVGRKRSPRISKIRIIRHRYYRSC